MPTSSVRFHRVIRAPAERLYRAFITPAALSKWFPPFGFTCAVDHIDAKIGGSYKMSFTDFSTGQTHSFGGRYLELTPNERLVYTSTFDDPNLAGEIRTSVALAATRAGTDVRIEQSGIPDLIPPENCYLGWQECLIQLQQLVEADTQEKANREREEP